MEEPITQICIMADYGGVYAWDQESVSDDIAYHFPNHPQYEALQVVENKLIKWSEWFHSSVQFQPSDFPWDQFHEEGIRLSKELAILIPEIPVFYQPPFEDPGRRNDNKIKIEPAI